MEDEIEDLPLELLQIADIYPPVVLLWQIGTRKSVNIPMGMANFW